MRFEETTLPGVFVIEPEPFGDERGFFARLYCAREFAAYGLAELSAQSSLSYNRRRGTLRGMHYQDSPHAEAKLVRCSRGAIYDVALDLRPDSPTRFRWVGVELTAGNRRMLYIPEGCAHGFQTLADDTEVVYQMSAFYHPESARGVLWNDPAFGIRWPLPVNVLSERDQHYALIERRSE